MTDTLKKFDAWLSFNGPAALVIREHLVPVEGGDGVLFPPTYAPAEDKKVFAGGYNIDRWGEKNVCLIDSVGAQANRIEPIFLETDYRRLVPQIVVTAGDNKVSLLEAGHRAGDAIVRCSPLKQELQDAFKAVLKGNAQPLAKIAPTSLVFGVWDSRDTQAKWPRLVSSTIRAFDVVELRRSAQFNPATAYVDNGMLEEPDDLRDAEGRVKGKHPFAQRGFTHVPASGSHGGVIANGGIRRDATLSLTALRLLKAGDDQPQTLALRRYILGLGLVAFTYSTSGFLRAGCQLVPNLEKPRDFVLVHHDGTRVAQTLTHADALEFARVAAQAFEPGKDREVEFDKVLAKSDLAGDESSGKKAKKAAAKK